MENAVVASLREEVAVLRAECDRLRELVPTPTNTWGAKGFEVHYDREGPATPPRWHLMLNGVGSYPIAYFYRKADAIRAAKAEAAIRDLEAQIAALKAPSPPP
jgi:hypothetical protein